MSGWEGEGCRQEDVQSGEALATLGRSLQCDNGPRAFSLRPSGAKNKTSRGTCRTGNVPESSCGFTSVIKINKYCARQFK